MYIMNVYIITYKLLYVYAFIFVINVNMIIFVNCHMPCILWMYYYLVECVNTMKPGHPHAPFHHHLSFSVLYFIE